MVVLVVAVMAALALPLGPLLKSQPPLRAFIANDREDVLAQARASTERIRSVKDIDSWLTKNTKLSLFSISYD